MSQAPRIRTVLGCTLLVIALGAGAAGCGRSGGDGNPLSAKPYDAAGQIAYNGPAGSAKADPDKPLEISARGGHGRITDVTAADAAGRYLAGELDGDGNRWHSTSPLVAGTHYTVVVSTEDRDGAPGRRTLTFDTTAPKDTVKVEFGPDAGKYGVGQPITAELSKPVKDKAARSVVERALKVESTPSVEGAWYWVDDKTLHYRPKDYWPAHATVRATSRLEGVRIADKLYGGPAKPLKITTGDRIEAITDAATHYMTVKRNGEVINTIPVTTGKPGFSTRNGVKVVLGKQYYVRMRGETVGISAGSADAYDLPVYYATRVTWSGEYVHAAPWSVGSQGAANVSHGCTGMSTGNAAWFYETVTEGDIVKVVNSIGEDMTPFDNGFGDWNVDWDKWRKGSVLQADAKAGQSKLNSARLRPQV